jgi:hypothetical protein
MEMIPQTTAAHANMLTNGPPNIIIAPKPIRPAPDQLDISFTLDIIQFILEPPFYLLNLSVDFSVFIPRKKAT